jgi:hypothetical protein
VYIYIYLCLCVTTSLIEKTLQHSVATQILQHMQSTKEPIKLSCVAVRAPAKIDGMRRFRVGVVAPHWVQLRSEQQLPLYCTLGVDSTAASGNRSKVH